MRWLLMGVVVALAFVVYTLFHCIMTPSTKVRALPKAVWLLAIIVLPVIGAALWYWLGMPRSTPASAAPARGRGPDDDAEFLRQLNIRRQQQQREAKLTQREAELKRMEEEFKRGTSTPENGSSGSSAKDGTGQNPTPDADSSKRDEPGH